MDLQKKTRHSLDDVAARLHVSPRTVRKLVKSGQLGCVQVTGHVIIFTEEQVAEFEIRQSIQARPAVSPAVDKTSKTPLLSVAKPVNVPKQRRSKTSVATGRGGEETSTWASRREEMRSWR